MAGLINELINDLALISNLKSRFNPLVDYYTKHGSISKITSAETYVFEGKEVRIGSLVSTLRRQYKHGLLSSDVVKALETIGMSWRHDQLMPLREYYKQYGTLAMIECKESIIIDGQQYSIGNLVTRLRKDYHKNLLSGDEIATLEAMGMVWKHDRMIGVREYYKQFGSLSKVKVGSNVSVQLAGKEINVANTLATLRAEYKNGKLSESEITELESMGMAWGKDVEFQHKLDILTDYYNKEGSVGQISSNDKYLYNGKMVEIGKHVNYLRRMWRDGNLSDDRIEMLDKLGMVWRVKNKRVDTFEVLKAYYKEFGTLANIKSIDTYNYNGQQVNIGQIVVNLRRDERKTSLTAEEVEVLDNMGFIWRGGVLFEDRIAPLIDYYNNFGSVDNIVSNQQYEFGGKMLNIGNLVHALRYEARNGKLTEEQKVALEAVGMNWDKKKQFGVKWDVLKAYYKQNGSIDQISVSETFEYKDVEYPIGRHIFELRIRYREGKLGNNEIRLLEKLGMAWRKRNEKRTFDEKIDILNQFTIETNKTLNNIAVEEKFKYNGEIIDVSLWTALFRQAYKNGELNDKQFLKLEQLGMNWNGRETMRDRRFEQVYSALCQYASQHNGTIANIKYGEIYKYDGEYIGLGEIVVRLRKNQDSLDADKIERLNKLGMVWYKNKFEYKLSVLQDYIDNGGKLSAIGDVSTYTYQGRNERIGRWMKTYRKEYSEGTLSQDKIDKLNDIGMVWDTSFNKGLPVKSR